MDAEGLTVVAASAPGDAWSASDGTGSAVATYGHAGCGSVDGADQCESGGWATSPGAVWIWRSLDAEPNQVATFTKKFYVSAEDVSDVGLLRIAADNLFSAELNGVLVQEGEQLDATINLVVPLRQGLNTLVVQVTNGDNGGGPWGNPAGLLWSIAGGPGLTASDLHGLLNPLTNYKPCACGDPVDNATGNFSETVEDLSASASGTGGLPVSATRSYNSLAAAQDGPFGQGWSSSYDWKLQEDATSGVVTVTAGNGATSEFFPDGDGGYGAGSQVLATLTKTSGGGWNLVRRPHSTFTFDSSGRLTAMSGVTGVTTNLAYSGGRLATVTDPVGRTLTYSYGQDGRVATVTGPDSRSVTYDYDAEGDLRSVTDAAGETTTMTYDDHRMLTRVDPEGGTTVNTYDSQGRVATQKDPAATAGSLPAMTWDYATGDNGASTTTVTDANGAVSVFEFRYNVFISKTNAFGTPLARTTTNVYGASLQPIKITDPLGNATKYSYDALGDVVKTGDAKGQVATFTYNAAGDRLTAAGPGTEPESSWTYSPDGLLLTATDPKGRTTTWTYTALGEVDTATTPRGKVTDFDYTDGNRTKSTSPEGNLTSWAYDPSGWLSSSTDPRGNVSGASPATTEEYTTHYTHDAMGRLLTATDPADSETTNVFDGNGNLTQAKLTTDTAAVVRTTDYTYSPTNLLKTQSVSGRTLITKTYDPVGHLTSTTDATGAETRYTYDAAGQLSTMITARGNESGATAADYTWTYHYDLAGNRTQVLDPQQRVTVTGYDELKRPVTRKTARGYITTTGYDPYNRVNSILDPLNRETTLTYTAAGEVETRTSPGLGPVTYEYDDDGNRVKETSPSGQSVTTWAHDGEQRLKTKVDPRGTVTETPTTDFTTTYNYDPAGNNTEVINQRGHLTSYTYDARNNLRTEKTPRGQSSGAVTTHTYDALNRDTSVTDATQPTGKTTSYTYDPYGNLDTRTDGRGNTTTYTHTDRGDLKTVTDPLEHVWSYEYDAEGNQTKQITARGNLNGGANAAAWTIEQDYDSRGLRTSVQTADASANATFGYDNDGRLTSFADTTGTTTLTMDNANQLTKVLGPDGTYLYAYNGPGGAISKRTLPSNGAVSYTFDTDGRIKTMAASSATTTYGYDVDDQLTNITYPSASGLVQTRTYDPTGQITEVLNKKGATVRSQFGYTLDPDSNPTLIATTRGTTVTNDAYNYDTNGRIARWCPDLTTCTDTSAKRITYGYDANGNKTTDERVGVPNPGTETREYNDADQLTTLISTTGAISSFSHDADGNRTTGDRTWDPLGRMTNSDTTTGIRYNALGHRRSQTKSSATTNYSWDINNDIPQLAVVTRGDGTKWSNRYDPTGQIQTTAHTGQNYTLSHHLHDRLGTVTDVTTNTGAAAWTYDYDHLGARTLTQPLATAEDTQFGYTGAYLEPNTGEYHLRARDYSPTNQAFVSPDPVQPTTGNPYISGYSYVNNQQTVLTDPTGQCPWCIAAGAVIGGVVTGGSYALTHQDDFSWKEMAGATAGGVVGGAISGATLGFGTTIGGAVVGGMASGLIAETVTSVASGNGLPSACEYAYAGISGGALGPLGYGSSKALSALRQIKFPNAAKGVGLSTRGLRPAAGTRVRPDGIPEGWRVTGTRSAGGTHYYDPTNRGNSVRVMQGNPNSPYPISQSPYVRWQQDGQALDRLGNKLPSPKDPSAHIPLDDFSFLGQVFR